MDRQNKRNALNDYQRFQVMVLRRQRNYDRSHLNSKKKAPPPAAKKPETPTGKTPKSKKAKGGKGKKSAGAQ